MRNFKSLLFTLNSKIMAQGKKKTTEFDSHQELLAFWRQDELDLSGWSKKFRRGRRLRYFLNLVEGNDENFPSKAAYLVGYISGTSSWWNLKGLVTGIAPVRIGRCVRCAEAWTQNRRSDPSAIFEDNDPSVGEIAMRFRIPAMKMEKKFSK